MRIDNIEAALLSDECTDLVSTNRLGYGWTYRKLASQQAFFRAGCKDGCDLVGAAADLQIPKRCAEQRDQTLPSYYLSSYS